mmetsp:Transcript_8740/g.14333  ORF Transcript_8740/g.14333 Transcript_8740/m.14333 type:complete len:766 (-) Transcript_8740:366-2663(-)
MPLILKALVYDTLKGSHSIGAHVRDAAYYVCWAFARAYEPDVLREHMLPLARGLLAVAVFDREVNCRRAASAAFQELVGRQGTFPHGIDIVTAADYFTLGNRVNAYLNVSVAIAQYDEYKEALVSYLLQHKASHWDSSLRELCARALGRLSLSQPERIIDTVLPSLVEKALSTDLNVRHGAAYAVGEIVLSLTTNPKRDLPPALSQTVVEITGKVEKARLYRGRGGEIMRGAICRLIECISIAALPLSTASLSTLLNTVDECLKHPNERIQSRAVAACKALCGAYYIHPNEKALQRITDKYVHIINTEDNPAARRGFCLAIGGLPAALLLPRLPAVIQSLVIASHIEESVDRRDAETRRNSVMAMIDVCHSVGINNSANASTGMPLGLVKDVQEALLLGLSDYSVDKRGDVGSWVREASLVALDRLVRLLWQASLLSQDSTEEKPLLEEFCQQVIGGMLQQASEKIDRVRKCAGEALARTLHLPSPPIQLIPCQSNLAAVIPSSHTFNWASASLTFPILTPLLSLSPYRFHILLGTVISVGGLTESVVKHSWSSLSQYLATIKHSPTETSTFADVLLDIFERYKGNERVVVPLFRALDLLLASDLLDSLLPSQFPFGSRLLQFCTAEIKGSKDIVKILSSIPVFGGLLKFDEPTRKAAMRSLLLLLRNRFPKVRILCSQEVYTRLLTMDTLVHPDSYDQVLAILSSTSWDSPLKETSEPADALFSLLNIEKPILSSANQHPIENPTFSSLLQPTTYEDLVKEAGY